MYRYATSALLLILIAAPAAAQEGEAEAEAPVYGWEQTFVGRLGGSQVGFQDWQGGGINSLAVSAGIDGEAVRTAERMKSTSTLRLGIGGVKQGEISLRKAEDIIHVENATQYLGEGFFEKFHPTLAASIRTQFIEGFNYKPEPAEKVSDFFSPATLVQSLGLTYEHEDWFKQRFGVAAKETVVMIERLRPLYGVDPADQVRFEAGLESWTEVSRTLANNVTLRSRLGLFAAFNNVGSPDALWENILTMKVNDFLNVAFELVTVYDQDVSDDVQIKEVLSVGFLFNLL